MTRKIACFGLSTPSRGFAPWGDESWEMWGLPWDSERLYFDRLFDMHDQTLNRNPSAGMPTDYAQRLAEAMVPIYMQRKFDEIPTSEPFPFEQVNAVVFREWGKSDYFPEFPRHEQQDWYGSHIAYMLALAIYEQATHIGLFGVDITQQRFDHDRPNLNYLIGLARGMGIKVYVPPTSHMFDMKRLDKLGLLTVEYPERYGFLKDPPKGQPK